MVLSKIAAGAASKNLELVTDAYARGALSILELLDAQNAALVSDLAQTNAEFTFAIDMVRAQRAAGGYFITLDGEARDAWIEQFEQYLKTHDQTKRPSE
jgi:outer membrane protein TolC